MTDLIIKQIQLTDTNDTVVSLKLNNLKVKKIKNLHLNFFKELFLHDSSGKAIYFENCKETWLSADMICIVFDITNKDSFGHSKFWYDKVKDIFQDNKKIIGKFIKL